MFVNSYPPEKIREVLNEFNSMITENKDNDLPHGWKGALAKRHKVPGGTMLGWIHRYGTADNVPDNLHGRGKEIQEPMINKIAGHRKATVPDAPIVTNCHQPSIDQLIPLKVIIADLFLENMELKRRLQEVA